MKNTQSQTHTQTQERPTIGGKPITQAQFDMGRWAFTTFETVNQMLNRNRKQGAQIVGSFNDFYLIKKSGETYKLNSQDDLAALLEYDTKHGYWSWLAGMERAAEFICREIAKPLPADFQYVSPIVKVERKTVVVEHAVAKIKSVKSRKKSK